MNGTSICGSNDGDWVRIERAATEDDDKERLDHSLAASILLGGITDECPEAHVRSSRSGPFRLILRLRRRIVF